ncbi:MAG: type II toxin-antitoxin system RelE/ParE family toxin [Alphaproteobacteria bacterium]|nr:type II toxin-antitoxin system RelE/ParE family toxin [Alphaproteobacteria bacterium]
MSLPIRISSEARVDLLEAWAWYEDQRLGLGDEFTVCVEAALEKVARFPEAWATVHGEVRRVIVRRFPYGVFYVVEDGELVVLAVAHGRREPGYWLSRRR